MSCGYCCNEQPELMKDFKTVNLREIDFSKYKTICVSGGEPLALKNEYYLLKTLNTIPEEKLIVLNTNGTRLDSKMFDILALYNINAINVGLHISQMFLQMIETINWAQKMSIYGSDIKLRYNLRDVYRKNNLENEFPDTEFHYWTLNQCERDNEDRFILKNNGNN